MLDGLTWQAVSGLVGLIGLGWGIGYGCATFKRDKHARQPYLFAQLRPLPRAEGWNQPYEFRLTIKNNGASAAEEIEGRMVALPVYEQGHGPWITLDWNIYNPNGLPGSDEYSAEYAFTHIQAVPLDIKVSLTHRNCKDSLNYYYRLEFVEKEFVVRQLSKEEKIELVGALALVVPMPCDQILAGFDNEI